MVDWRVDSGRLEGGQWYIGGLTVVDWRVGCTVVV